MPTFHSNFSVFLVYSLHGSGLISFLDLEIKLKIWCCILASQLDYGAFWYLTECNNKEDYVFTDGRGWKIQDLGFDVQDHV